METLLFSIISALVVAIAVHHLASSRLKRNDLSGFQIQAYSDFIGAVSKIAVARRLGDTSNEIEDLALLNNAKSRILVGGDPDVVKALVEFWECGATLELEHELLSFKRLIQTMRVKLGHKENDLLRVDIDVSGTLYKLEPSTYSYKDENDKTS